MQQNALHTAVLGKEMASWKAWFVDDSSTPIVGKLERISRHIKQEYPTQNMREGYNNLLHNKANRVTLISPKLAG